MIPVVLVAGLLVRRWWAVPGIAFGWALLLLPSGASSDLPAFLSAMTAAGANAAIGVLTHRGIASIVSDVRRESD